MIDDNERLSNSMCSTQRHRRWQCYFHVNLVELRLKKKGLRPCILLGILILVTFLLQPLFILVGAHTRGNRYLQVVGSPSTEPIKSDQPTVSINPSRSFQPSPTPSFSQEPSFSPSIQETSAPSVRPTTAFPLSGTKLKFSFPTVFTKCDVPMQ